MHRGREAENPSSEPSLATQADFDAVDFEAPVRGHDVCDVDDLYGFYERAFAAARDAGDEPERRVYHLLGQICGIGLHPSDPGDVWHPRWQLGADARSTVTEDLFGAMARLLATAAAKIDNLALRARCADVAWSNDRRDGASATSAVEAYCGIVNGLLDGHLKTLYGLKPTFASVTPMHRALQISRFTTRLKNRPACVTDTFDRLEAAARDGGDVGILVQLAELAHEFRLRDTQTLAAGLVSAARATSSGTYPEAVKSAWDFAARLYDGLRDTASRQLCLMGAVEQTLAMRTRVIGAVAEAYWVMEALQQLRHVQGQESLELKLEVDLRRLQKASMAQMAMFEVPMDVGDVPEKVAEHFRFLGLSEALRDVSKLDQSRDPEHLRTEARDIVSTSPLMASMPFTFVDEQGRTVTRSPGAPHGGEPDEVWFTHMIDHSETLHRQKTVSALIHPARLVVQAKFGLMPRHFEAIVASCPIIPEPQRPVMALGFTRFFQGDLMSAAYLLIPQIEPLLRQVLKVKGYDPSKRRDDSTEQDLSLANIYLRFRGELESILTPALTCEIDRLFNKRPGPALRHEIAHGQASGGDCYSPNSYYAVWLIYRLCCLFVLGHWDEIVTPHLTADGGD